MKIPFIGGGNHNMVIDLPLVKNQLYKDVTVAAPMCGEQVYNIRGIWLGGPGVYNRFGVVAVHKDSQYNPWFQSMVNMLPRESVDLAVAAWEALK